MQMGLLLPPHGLLLMTMKGVAPPQVTMLDIFRAVVPFLVMSVLLLIFLGVFVDQVSMMMITLPIFMPVVQTLNIDGVWFGVMYLICMCKRFLARVFVTASAVLIRSGHGRVVVACNAGNGCAPNHFDDLVGPRRITDEIAEVVATR